jgi:hypothetical protein
MVGATRRDKRWFDPIKIWLNRIKMCSTTFEQNSVHGAPTRETRTQDPRSVWLISEGELNHQAKRPQGNLTGDHIHQEARLHFLFKSWSLTGQIL